MRRLFKIHFRLYCYLVQAKVFLLRGFHFKLFFRELLSRKDELILLSSKLKPFKNVHYEVTDDIPLVNDIV